MKENNMGFNKKKDKKIIKRMKVKTG